ncbi:MAG TPA: hypothetical protein VNX26_00290 [Candidatus Acidoferrum sp.]|nr:hypothetical protein [Candidatus Acidoferrum sp.]
MEDPAIDPPNGRRLDSWKVIAAYLDRHERTVVRWEKKGLPVYRVPGGERQAVFAYTGELDAWLRRGRSVESTAHPRGMKRDSSVQGNGSTEVVPFPRSILAAFSGSPKPTYYALAGAAAVSVLLFALFSLRSRAAGSSFPLRVGFTLNAIQAFDDKEQVLWTHTFPGTLDASVLGQRLLSSYSYIGDFRGKGEREVLVIAPLRGDLSPDPAHVEVDLFSSRGQLLWTYVPQGRFQFGTHDVNGPWTAGDLFVSSVGGRTQIWLAVTHLVWGNSFVVNLDPATGKDILRYVNTGTIRALSELKTPQANFLLAGGFNNEGDTGSLAVINEAKPFAASPQGEGTRHKCANCAPGNPDYYFEFPRSEINELEQVHEAAVIRVNVTGDQIELRKHELVDWGGPQTHYTLKADHGFRVVAVRFGSAYDMLHRKLEQEGKLDHTLENCPERLHPRPIEMWTPAGGWTEITLDPSRASE